MSDESFNQPSEHEQEVAQEEREREGDSGTDASHSTYEREVDAEQQGTTAEQLDDQADDEESPLDSAYRPKTG
ncbi:MAG TPA: hypothetical protein VF153_03135 [Candidatus Limnocylindria bacterium]